MFISINLFSVLVCCAGLAQTGELNTVGIDGHCVFAFGIAALMLQTVVQLNIHHAAAAAAQQVGVGVVAGIKSFLALQYPDDDRITVCNHFLQIAVDCCQAQVGIFGLQLLVHPFRTGMLPCGGQCVVDGFSLFTVTFLDRHVRTSFSDNDYRLQDKYIIGFGVCKEGI